MNESIRWIDVSTQLPDAGSQVLVCFERNDCEERDVAIAGYDDSYEEGNHWQVDGDLMCFGTVLYWAEIPVGPYRSPSNDKYAMPQLIEGHTDLALHERFRLMRRRCERFGSVSVALVEVGKDDDIKRLREQIENGPSEDKLNTACEIAIAWIRFAQDLKEELRAQRAAGYL